MNKEPFTLRSISLRSGGLRPHTERMHLGGTDASFSVAVRDALEWRRRLTCLVVGLTAPLQSAVLAVTHLSASGLMHITPSSSSSLCALFSSCLSLPHSFLRGVGVLKNLNLQIKSFCPQKSGHWLDGT